MKTTFVLSYLAILILFMMTNAVHLQCRIALCYLGIYLSKYSMVLISFWSDMDLVLKEELAAYLNDPPEPAVLDNFVKSLFGQTVAVTASFKTRRTQEVISAPLSTFCDGRKRGLFCPFQKQEGTRSFLPAQGLARGWGL
jgi:hypothetical protein